MIDYVFPIIRKRRRGDLTPGESTPTGALRFVLREGKHILQQEYRTPLLSDLCIQDYELNWRDVPLVMVVETYE